MSKWLYSNFRLLIIIICSLVVWGFSSLQVLPRMEDPSLSQRSAFITTSFPNANPRRVESLVTERIEQKLFEIAEVDTTSSVSRLGSSVIFVELKDSVVDVDRAWSIVRDKVDDVVPELPAGAQTPKYQEIEARAYTLITALVWNLEDTPSYAILNRIGKELEAKLRSQQGTEKVEIVGSPKEEIIVAVNASDIAAFGLTTQQLSQQIVQSDAKVSAGQMYDTDSEIPIEVETELDSTSRIRQIPIRLSNSGQFARLGDFASVTKGIAQPASEIALVDGKPAVVLATLMQPSWRIDKWKEITNRSLEEFQKRLPPGISLEVIFAQSIYVDSRLNELFTNLLLGALCVVGSTFFIMGWKSALIVGSALPLSVLMVFGGMRILEIPLHQMSVTGLVIALGLLIDNAVVVVDEVQHKLQRGLEVPQAIEQTLNYLTVPLLASTLTTVLAFMPIVLLPGNTGEFVRTIAISVILALFSSLFLSLAVIPALVGRLDRVTKRNKFSPKLSQQLLSFSFNSSILTKKASKLTKRKIDNHKNWWSDGFSHPLLTAIYRQTLNIILKRPLIGILLALILPVTGFLFSSTLEEQFFPPSERAQIYLELELPSQASLQQTQFYAQQIRDRILQHPEADRLFWFIGRDGPPFYYNLRRDRRDLPNYAQGIVQLKLATNSEELVKTLQTELDRNFPAVQVLVRQLEQGPTVDAPVELYLYGDDLNILRELGVKLRKELVSIEEVTHSSSSLGLSSPKLGLQVDEEQARLAGLDPTEIAQQLASSLSGTQGGSILEDTEEIPVRVRLDRSQRSNLEQISSLGLRSAITTEGENSSNVPLSSLSKIELVPELSIISRRNGKRVNTVRGFIRAGVLPSTVLTTLKQRLESSDFQLPPGYSLSFGGEAAERDTAVSNLISTVGILLMLMMAILVLSFSSFRAAGIIALVAICSLGLGLFSLWWFEYPLGFMAILGTIGLIGVAINDSIVVLAAIRSHPQARQGDIKAMREVIVDSTRHILTTTITTVAGFLPLVIAGGDFWTPLAVCMVGGVSGATLLALYFVPCTYLLLLKKL